MSKTTSTNSVTRQLLQQAAIAKGLQIDYLTVGNHEYMMRLTDDTGHSELLLGTLTSRSSVIGNKISQHKQLTLAFINSLGIATPEATMFETMDQATNFMQLHQQIVVKPVDAEQSKGVSTNVTDVESLKVAVEDARQYALQGGIQLQKQIAGKLYRLFVLNGKLVAAAHRRAAQVVGDGQHTVAELTRQLNEDPRRGDGATTPLKRISEDSVRSYVGDALYGSVPAVDEVVQISPIDSISAGGEAANVTGMVHPDYARMVERISSELQLFVCGFDLLCDDIAMPPQPNYLPVLEINSMPGLKLHQYPTAGGEPINLAAIMLDELFS